MSRSITANDDLVSYVQTYGVREHPVLAKCREETQANEEFPNMQISPEQGAFMALLAQSINAKRIIEIGTFTGYSTLSFALALSENARITACDISKEHMTKANGYWSAAGVSHKITPIIGPAGDTLDQLIANISPQTLFDLAFIDADKTNYDIYYEKCLTLLREGGLILIDNVLWGGAVIDKDDISEDTQSIRDLNEKIANDERVDLCMTVIGDGVTLCRKR